MGNVETKPMDLKERTKRFGLRIVRLVRSLPVEFVAQEIGRQLLRSGMSVGANCRAAFRGRSPAEYRAKLGIVEEEADEAGYWLELLAEAEIVKPELLEELMKEAHEIVAIVITCIRKSRDNERNEKT